MAEEGNDSTWFQCGALPQRPVLYLHTAMRHMQQDSGILMNNASFGRRT